MTKKFYELTRGDQANHGGEILTFQKVDGAYVFWLNDKGELRMGHAYEYELKDGIYYPVTK